MHAINEFLEGFGVESLELADNQKWVDKYYMWSRASYVNMGDTYAATILRDNKTGSYTIKSWGDFVEAQSKKVRFK